MTQPIPQQMPKKPRWWITPAPLWARLVTSALVIGTAIVWGLWDLIAACIWGGAATESVFMAWLISRPWVGRFVVAVWFGLGVHFVVICCYADGVSRDYLFSLILSAAVGAIILGTITWWNWSR